MPLSHRWSIPLVVVALLNGCAAPPTPVPTRVEASPAGVLLTAGNPDRQLTAVVFDQFDHPIDVPVTWSSSAPAQVSVTADGLVQAQVTPGSAVISAAAGGVKGSLLVVSAEPVEGAVVIGDDNVVGEPRPLGPGTEFGVGYQYEATLVGAGAPAVGTVLLTDGAKAVAGKVVAVAGSVVTLEVVPIDEVFAALDIDASIDLSSARFVTPQGIAAAFETERLADGSYRLRQRPGVELTSPGSLTPLAEFGAGPFRCETEFTTVQVTLAQASVTFQPSLSYDIVWNGTQRKIVVRGSPKASFDVTPMLSAAIDGKVTCKLTFREIQVPVPGPLGLLIAAVVPIGGGFELGGKLPVAQVGAQFTSEVGATLQLGFDCDPDCLPVQSLTHIVSGNAKPVVPSALTGLKLEAGAHVFVFVNLEGGARFSSTLRVEAIEATAGLKLDAKLATEETQAFDDAYASEYDLSFEAVIGAGSGFQRFLDLVKVTVAKLELKVGHGIAKSPRGTVEADRPEFASGETVNFTVTLDAATTTFPVLGHNVASVRIYRKTVDSLVLANQGTVAAGQTELHLPWVATVDGTVEGNFVAFVETVLLPTPRLELGPVKANEPVTATYTFTRVEDTHVEQSVGSFSAEEDHLWQYSATLQLRVIGETPTSKQFDIVSGTVSVSGTDDYVEVLLGEGFGDCTYDSRIEDHWTTAGSGPVSGTLVLTLSGATYDIDAPSGSFEADVDGVWSVVHTYHGPETDCRTDVVDPYQHTSEESLRMDAGGSFAPGSPTIFAGSEVEVIDVGGETGTVTTTWQLEIQ